WVAERVEVLDAPVVGTVVEVPVRRVIYQPAATAPMSEEELETLAQYVEILGPVVVRPLDNGFFELVAGHRVFDVLVNRLGYESVRALVLDVDDTAASSMRAEYEEKVEKLVKTALNR
ncbi:MAG: ParB N-terminal domain-containing protein, partial [Candidatus Caldarchaeum sp.]